MSAPIPKLAGVCGWPIHHSLSPQLHSFWLRKMGVAGAYVPFLVRPDEALHAFRSLAKTSIAGVNVTLPLKQAALEAADAATDDARQLGAANVLYRRGGRLVAHNTDREGFAAPLLDRLNPKELSHVTALVVGAGGAARAVVGALGWLGLPEIRVSARRDGQAEALTDGFSLPSVYPVAWGQRHEALRGAALVVNATSGGMVGKPALDLDLGTAGEGAVAYDLIYTPRETPFLAQARERGMDTIGGLEMLVAQARPAFAIFYGQTPPPELDPTPVLEALL